MLFGNFLNLATNLATRLAFSQQPLISEVAEQTLPPHGNVVDLGYAKYLGNQTITWPNAVAYLGLPFAEPPLGDLRWRAPVPLNQARVAKETRGNVVDATYYPDFCIQGSHGSGDHGGAGAEDCLKVNVYAPAGAKPGDDLPVVVYMHGGGYVFGNPASWPFDHWVNQSPNVIAVVIYYRLNGFGFLSTPDFVNGEHGDLNVGFLDQIEGLQWIQDHIHKFGGDPSKVTITGESGGGSAIELHLVAYDGKTDLFRGAIAQSPYRTPVPQPEQQQALFDAFVNKAGCGSGDINAKMSCMRSASVSTLAFAQDYATSTVKGYNTFHPVVDGKSLTDYPTRLIQKGIFKKVPLIVGATSNETSPGSQGIHDHAKGYFPSISDESIQRLEDAYPLSDFASEELRQQRLCSDYSFSATRAFMASEWNKAGIPSWTYRYNQPDPADGGGAAHGAENYMMFRGVHTSLNGTYSFAKHNTADIAFSHELIAYWVSFARDLNPNTYKVDRAPVWPGYSVHGRHRIVLEEPVAGSDVESVSGSYIEIESEKDAKRCYLIAERDPCERHFVDIINDDPMFMMLSTKPRPSFLVSKTNRSLRTKRGPSSHLSNDLPKAAVLEASMLGSIIRGFQGSLAERNMIIPNIFLLAVWLAFQRLTSASPFSTSATPGQNVVDLGYVKYLGNRTATWPNSVTYLGIPYAEPPLGDRRYRAPLPLDTARIAREAGGSVVDARAYPDFCIQGAISADDHGGAGSEDCLKINVYTPAGTKPNAKLPVLAYIHGGGYVYGNPANWPFEHWIQQSPNVVIVSIYYRLDSFGFLSTPGLQDGKLGDLNAGFSDQIEALRWVQKYIDKFGGDPERVTINGQSAGGSSVELHLVASSGKERLFSGGIGQSVTRTPVPTPEQQRPLFDAFTQGAGCGSGSLADKMACLRSASISSLAIAQDNASATLTGYHSFHPVVDKKIITDYPTRLIQKGKFRKVPIIMGSTTNETHARGPTIPDALHSYFPSISDKSITTLEKAYPLSAFPSADLRQQILTGDVSFRCSRAIMASAWDAAGVKAYTYRYNQPDPATSSPETGHSAENYMMFRGTHTGINGTTAFSTFNPSEITFSEELIAYWLSFVRTFDPSIHKLARAPVWREYTARRRNRIVLNEAPEGADVDSVSGSHMEVEEEDAAERCQVVAGLVDEMED
ncbi:hypothetical protein NP233_g5780 [Leucocoprinus birnbaumii]|uniref:Carboxylesterase type B domain-containing protein n=1 Tax=Leucocoprinus birnbaumii TaxID=56174 RepID=A0AAD5VTH3_9AGAR|nr:hypothetical protein NP233_g5780 [Leucocoprinus birnbaumii]